METTLKTGWWASKSTGAKWGIGLTVTAILGAITALVIKYNKKDAPIKSIGTESTPIVKPKIEVQNNTSDISLPNKGVDCSLVYINYDNDFDYVKCGGIWYTKSKENPKTATAKDKYKEWTSLEKNVVATTRLNKRYP